MTTIWHFWTDTASRQKCNLIGITAKRMLRYVAVETPFFSIRSDADPKMAVSIHFYEFAMVTVPEEESGAAG
jgi:hypothetical protein